MKQFGSKELLDAFDSARENIIKSTEGKSEDARLFEAFALGWASYMMPTRWHDADKEKHKYGKIVFVRVVGDMPGIDPSHCVLYGTSADSWEEIFPHGFRVTHWAEIVRATDEGAYNHLFDNVWDDSVQKKEEKE